MTILFSVAGVNRSNASRASIYCYAHGAYGNGLTRPCVQQEEYMLPARLSTLYAHTVEGAAMRQYIIKRLLLLLPTLIGAALVVFLLMHVVPGDVALLILGGDQGGDINPQELVKLRTQLGLNQPLYVQFLSWLWGVVHLNFGKSHWTGTPVM